MQSCKQQHFILVHGICHGAWCWYKVATVLQAAGHLVTALDLAACGASPMRVDELSSFAQYSRPLLDAVAAMPPGEKAVLVGHSYGGHNLALTMQTYPHKIAVAVFVSATMPVAGSSMSIILEQILKEKSPDHGFMDSKSQISKNPKNPVETFLLGPNCMSRMLYQLSPPEDLTLATMLVRPAQWFIDDVMMKETILTEEKYGAVSRVFVVAENDNLWPAEAQRQVAKLSPGTVVRSIEGADHMPMLSKPRELSELLMEIASKYYN